MLSPFESFSSPVSKRPCAILLTSSFLSYISPSCAILRTSSTRPSVKDRPTDRYTPRCTSTRERISVCWRDSQPPTCGAISLFDMSRAEAQWVGPLRWATKLHKPTTAIGRSLRMSTRHVDSTNPGRSNKCIWVKTDPESEMSNRLAGCIGVNPGVEGARPPQDFRQGVVGVAGGSQGREGSQGVVDWS